MDSSETAVATSDETYSPPEQRSRNDDWTVVKRNQPPPRQQRYTRPAPMLHPSDRAELGGPSTILHRGAADIKKQRNIPRQYYNDKAKHLAKVANSDDVGRHRTVRPELIRRLQEYRRQHQLTQEQLANLVSLPETVIRDYERPGTVADSTIVSKLQQFLERAKNRPETIKAQLPVARPVSATVMLGEETM